MKLLLYDGTCNLCHWAVQWVKRNAVVNNFQFEPLESDFGKQMLGKYPQLKAIDSIVFLDESGVYVQSAAVFQITKYLKYPWPILQVFKVFPRIFCDAVYAWVAKNRKKWFGNRNECDL